MKKIKLVFSSSVDSGSENYFLSPIFWMLRMYHENFGQSKDQWDWTTPYAIINVSDKEQSDLVDVIVNHGIDLIAFSMYAWNRELVLSLSKKLKSINPSIIIVIGGPDVDAHRDNNFFNTHSYIDYAVYGDGEEAFTRLLDHIAGHDVNLINVADKNQVHPHQVFKNKSALSISPFIHYKEDFINFYEFLFNYFKKHNIKQNIAPVWETTKGCPYACSFCDWSSGLHNKVRIWGKDELIPNWKKEIDLFFEIQDRFSLNFMCIEWTNPNIGLVRQDEEIIDYWCQLKKSLGRGPIIRSPQLSKLNKETTFRLLDKMLEANITSGFKFDVQDIDQEVLKNVDRPEIPWEEHKKYILALKNKWKKRETYFIENGNKYKNRINFIWGLPGQTINHLRNNIIEAGSVRSYAFVLPFDLLPNSPAFTEEYQEKYKLKYKKITYANTELMVDRAVVSTYSLTEYDYYYGYILSNIYSIFYSIIRAPIIGQEHKIFDNAYKISELIDRSYVYFEKEGVIGLENDNLLMSVADYVLLHKDELIEIFDLK